MSRLLRLCLDQSGAALPEYSLVMAIIGVLSITSLAAIANAAATTLTDAYQNFEQLQQTPPQ